MNKYPKRKAWQRVETKMQTPHPQQLRHTHCTAAGIEDCLAVLIDVQDEIDILKLRVLRAQDILREVRAGPHAYDEDRPAGERLTIRRLR